MGASFLHSRLIALPCLNIVDGKVVLHPVRSCAQIGHLLVKVGGLQDGLLSDQPFFQFQPGNGMRMERAAFFKLTKQGIGLGNGRFKPKRQASSSHQTVGQTS